MNKASKLERLVRMHRKGNSSQILEFIKKKKRCNQGEIVKSLDIRQADVSLACKEAISCGYVNQFDQGKYTYYTFNNKLYNQIKRLIKKYDE